MERREEAQMDRMDGFLADMALELDIERWWHFIRWEVISDIGNNKSNWQNIDRDPGNTL